MAANALADCTAMIKMQEIMACELIRHVLLVTALTKDPQPFVNMEMGITRVRHGIPPLAAVEYPRFYLCIYGCALTAFRPPLVRVGSHFNAHRLSWRNPQRKSDIARRGDCDVSPGLLTRENLRAYRKT